jgi:4-hydroxybenzoate polyprenyltransferase
LLSTLFLFLGLVLNKFAGVDLSFILLILAFFLAQIFTFLINDYFDREHDKFSDKKKLRNVFCNDSQKIRQLALLITIGCFLLSLLLVIPINFEIFLLILLYQLITLQYSSPPLRIKDHPPFDVLTHGFALSIVSVAGYIYFYPINDLFIFIFILALVLGIIPQVGQQVHDYNIDKLSLQNTSTTLIGERRAKLLLRFLVGFTIFWLLAMTYLFSQENLLLISIMLISLTILYIFARNYKKERVYLALEVGITLFLL